MVVEGFLVMGIAIVARASKSARNGATLAGTRMLAK
jgi:hypothetical protein